VGAITLNPGGLPTLALTISLAPFGGSQVRRTSKSRLSAASETGNEFMRRCT